MTLLREHRCVLVALSGGVDSAVLLALSREALGESNVLAVTGQSPAVTSEDVRDAREVARSLGVRHEIIHTREMDRTGYRRNSGDRCFHCRSELFEALFALAPERGCDAVAYGAIVDDLGDHRPGMEAARERGVLAPMLDAGIGKTDVRTFATWYGLHIYDKPSNPCLASRIPIGTEVTPERLAQVGQAEAALRRAGFRVVRVRHHGEIARIELGEGERDRFRVAAVRAEVVRSMKDAGFRYAVVDLEAYRSGGAGPEANEPRLYSIETPRDRGQ